MHSIQARWRVGCALCLVAFAACASDTKTKLCSANGETYFCPEGTECGGIQQLCVPRGGCGNGVTEGEEQCDDGNLKEGDGCSPICRIEVCGNHTTDPGELCDDGNTASGDGCSADCKSLEVCGNLRIDADRKDSRGRGEVCDDGNNLDGDGCSADCRSTEICGNHIIDMSVGEICDDGPDGSPNCSPNCRSTLQCNNRSIDPGEECDNGLFGANNTGGNDNHNDCRADCVINRCGDGHVDSQLGMHHEECDGGPAAASESRIAIPTETDTCNSDCTVATCGDGKINRTAGEQCDDHNTSDNDGCSVLCKLEFCGDGTVNNREPCDRALTPATCNLDCTPSACGDGKLNAAGGEQCDDGNTGNNDGCSDHCQLEHCGNGAVDAQEECDGLAGLQPCSATCHQERCGNGIQDRDPTRGINEQCDDGNLNDNDGCSATCVIESCGDGKLNNGEVCDRALTPATCNLDCTASSCGDGKLNPSAVPPEQCDDHNTGNDDGCSATCTLEHCGNDVVDAQEECDGFAGLQPCSATCHQERCGNGIQDRDPTRGIDEQCDDGNLDPNDGCSAACVIELCGDGTLNNREACDRALTPATCNLDCTPSSCGDGKLNPSAVPPEQCDDHNTGNDDGCSATCTLEHCGNGVVDAQEECDGFAGLQPCSATCHQERCGNGIQDRDLAHGIAEQCDDGNLNPNDGCSATCVIEFCGDGTKNNGEPCDRALTPATCNLDCTPSSCGDGKLNPSAVPAEQCDDGNTTASDGCSSLCTLEHCGNGVVDAQEDCDGAAGLQPCSATCHQERCGNGIQDRDPARGVNEQCDDNNTIAGDGCSGTCVIEFCGDGTLNNGEVCDRAATPATCNLDCTPSLCGDGKLNASAVPPEQCDDANTRNNDGCSGTCTLEHCGNGVVDAQEDCDSAAGLQPCSATCHQERCGNGIQDRDPTRGVDEQCDDGNLADNDGCSAACEIERCGDGKLNNGEVCDRAVTPATCNLDCTPSSCGDGKLNPSAVPAEQCDDHNVTRGDGCSATCQFEFCGDGIVEAPEECDGTDGPQPCSRACRQERCGNGIIEHDLTATPAIDEQCDDGNTVDDDRCSNTCTVTFCGDGIVNNGEACDRAKTPATCNLDCTASECGDGKLNPFAGEQCDDGNRLDNDGCSGTCTRELCGDGTVNNGEVCDRAATPVTCNLDCTPSECGDGKLNADAGEQCDDTNVIPGDGCSATCKFEFCGDGIRQLPEECDGLDGPQPCSAICHQERCGNAIVEIDTPNGINEQCDNGSTGPNGNDDTHACTSTCQVATCGDGHVEAGVEQCDDGTAGNSANRDCTSDCRINVCGDGLLDSLGTHLEECDNGQDNTNNPTCPYNTSCTLCSTTCRRLTTVVPHCGDGIVQGPLETCDDHNVAGCGTCSPDCQAATAARALGFIAVVAGPQLLDGETFTLDDGLNLPVVFELDRDATIAAGHVRVAVTATDSLATVRTTMVNAIRAEHTAGRLLIDATTVGTTVISLVHDRPTTVGNHPIDETVADVTFFVIGMLGGDGIPCSVGTGCQIDDDCESHACNPLIKLCGCSTDADCPITSCNTGTHLCN